MKEQGLFPVIMTVEMTAAMTATLPIGKLRAMNTSTHTVLFDCSEHVASITLNKPERHNSLGAVELARLAEIFEELRRRDEIRVVVLTGAGDRTFCSGAALNELNSGAISPELFAATTTALAALPQATVCALNGSVFGGGCEFALSCDFRIGAYGMRAFVPASKFGLVYPPSGIEKFVQCFGITTALRFLLAAEEFDAEALLNMGFVMSLHDKQNVLAAAETYAEALAAKAPLAVRAMKEIALAFAKPTSAELQRVHALISQCNESSDLAEGMLAASEKRSPVFHAK